MGYVLKNKNLELKIDLPLENYNFSRFDWTGKITELLFKNTAITTVEDPKNRDQYRLGKGFYNEFGIDTPVGFDETDVGGWFHKIGIGLLKKEDEEYGFSKSYQIRPANFRSEKVKNQVRISCRSPLANGYAYALTKEIELFESGFAIRYTLTNRGEKPIHTEEYNHNFLAFAKDSIGENYHLKLPFELQPELFEETVNPDSAVTIGTHEVSFNTQPNDPFFFSNVTGSKVVPAAWQLWHLKSKIGIRAFTDFQTDSVNLWGWRHVISPELFIKINIEPNDTMRWTRRYELFEF